jgi:hypothetical protein
VVRKARCVRLVLNVCHTVWVLRVAIDRLNDSQAPPALVPIGGRCFVLPHSGDEILQHSLVPAEIAHDRR